MLLNAAACTVSESSRLNKKGGGVKLPPLPLQLGLKLVSAILHFYQIKFSLARSESQLEKKVKECFLFHLKSSFFIRDIFNKFKFWL